MEWLIYFSGVLVAFVSGRIFNKYFSGVDKMPIVFIIFSWMLVFPFVFIWLVSKLLVLCEFLSNVKRLQGIYMYFEGR